MNPQFPIYVVSKGRADTRFTSKTLDEMRVPYFVVIEKQEFKDYSAVIDSAKLLILDPKYQTDYDTCDNLGDSKSKGPGAARNFAWDHAIKSGAEFHWVMDDNINRFARYNHNTKIKVTDGTPLRCMEDFVLRYENVAMAGPNYELLVPAISKSRVFVPNTRIYSCNLIRNSIPYRWRGRYNEDTDLSLRILKDGWCTIQFNAFLQGKLTTQSVKGGCNADFYQREGTMPKSQMQVNLHPDVSRIAFRFGRWHHYVDYRPFKMNKLIRKPAPIKTSVDNYGMILQQR
jgi:TET-associated glycosyltransferase-like protein